MESISKITSRYNLKKEKVAPHEQAAKVDEILKIVKETKKHSYKYWLAKVRRRSYSDVLQICKEASQLPSKYNVGGFITNKLCYKKTTTQ